MRYALAVLLVGLLSASAFAGHRDRSNVDVSIGFGYSSRGSRHWDDGRYARFRYERGWTGYDHYRRPRPVYVAPRCEPEPVYCPPPRYYRPAPIVIVPTPPVRYRYDCDPPPRYYREEHHYYYRR